MHLVCPFFDPSWCYLFAI